MNKIYTSQDGSDTLISDRFNVFYHSKYGAINESMTVFINAGFKAALQNEKTSLNIFEMGFGTGLNPLLTLIEATKTKKKTNYTGIEAYPISKETVFKLNYTDLLDPSLQSPFIMMHGSQVEENIYNLKLSPEFTFSKIIGDIEITDIGHGYDVIYFDAFAPESQPSLWETPLLQKLYDALAPNGILVTYCAKGVFKRALKAVGFTVEALPGPIGKREITRATKQ
jgi:tRNA U34 5-methylaminomethyl-2-thiouridine-forming methyltransferase MnmC